MIHLWDSLSGKVWYTSLMKKGRLSLWLSPVGMDMLMSCVRSVVRQFLILVSSSWVWKAARLAERDRFVLHQRVRSLTYSSSEKVEWFGVFVGLVVSYVLVPTYGWTFSFGYSVMLEGGPILRCLLNYSHSRIPPCAPARTHRQIQAPREPPN
jgi:hypothetical protein